MLTLAACLRLRRNCWGREPVFGLSVFGFELMSDCRCSTSLTSLNDSFPPSATRSAVRACHTLFMSARPEPGSTRDLLELIFGYGLILFVLWMPEFPQRILSPVALVVTLSIVLARRPGPEGRFSDLGIGRHGLARSFWILPAAIVLATTSVLIARQIGTLHSLYKGDFKHISGYVLWTLYQQFLMNDLFMPRLTRLLGNETGAVGLAAVLFAAAHLPNLPLTAATLIWGAVSCALFQRYRNLYALGLAQGLLGLCFAVCVPDAMHHHLRVGLGYLRYSGTQPGP
jgi:hypothetical protein